MPFLRLIQWAETLTNGDRMKISKVRRILGDTSEPHVWDDDVLTEWVEEADPYENEYTVAADILSAHYNALVLSGGGTSVRSDDITVNDYNNLVLLRDKIRDLRNHGMRVGEGFALEFPYDWR